jgi:hypothetical protein
MARDCRSHRFGFSAAGFEARSTSIVLEVGDVYCVALLLLPFKSSNNHNMRNALKIAQ